MKKILISILYGVLPFVCPITAYCQTAPNLGTASSFVLFTGNGEFTSNSASSNITGDVGNLVGAVNAFPPGTLIGTKHFGDVTADQVNTDIAAAYTDLANRTCGTVHAVAFGLGETLTPGTYCASASSTLDGLLTLDAGGNPGAIFIIKIDGAFSAASGSQIFLLNNASANNVYWQINGAVDLNNTDFKGTMLVNGAISLNNGTVLRGRALTKTGALIFGNITATVPNLSVLPLKLLSFDLAKTTNSNILVSWSSTSESNMNRYEIEASTNSTTFYRVGTVNSTGSSQSTQYSFEDANTVKTGIRFYRLKMVDKDGVISYSSVKSVKFSDITIDQINIYPNPVSNTLNLSVTAESQGKISLTITNMQGQKMIQKTLLVKAGINNLSEDIYQLPKAQYVVIIKNVGSGKEMHQNFQKL